MGSWGSELWDGYSSVLSHVTRGCDELSSVFAKFIKEKGDMEKEYAKNIRKLVRKYTHKMEGKETTQAKGFRLLLREMGYQAGQHEILAEMLTIELQEDIQEKTKELSEATKKNHKGAKKLSDGLDTVYKDLDKTRSKYQRSFLDWQDAKEEYIKATEEGILSRKEIAKLKSLSDSRNAQCEDYKGAYASQLMKMNKAKDEYYYNGLPGVLNCLENVEIDRINYLKHILGQCVAAEKQAAHIIDKCRGDMEKVLDDIDPVADSQTLVESLKTGELPPTDLDLDEIFCRTDIKLGTLGSTKSRVKLNKCEEATIFQKKREIEREIKNMHSKIEKGKCQLPGICTFSSSSVLGNKEIAALQLMVQSYTDNPKFGDAKNFQSELDSAIYNVQMLESDLHALNIKLKDINEKLDSQQTASPNIAMSTQENSPRFNRSYCINVSEVKVEEHGAVGLDDKETVVALYPFEDDTIENSITMKIGEEFLVTEVDDGGWTKVKRKNIVSEEGYVPTAYLQRI